MAVNALDEESLHRAAISVQTALGVEVTDAAKHHRGLRMPPHQELRTVQPPHTIRAADEKP